MPAVHVGMVDAPGADRVMPGTDLPENVGVMKESVRVLGLSDEDAAMVMDGSADRTFKLDI